MNETADEKLCQELHKLLGWDGPGLKRSGSDQEGVPAYTLGFIVDKILPISSVKFKKTDGKVVATAPQAYRIEAETAANAACLFALELCKRGELKK